MKGTIIMLVIMAAAALGLSGCNTTFGRAFAKSWENTPPKTKAQRDAETAAWRIAHGKVDCNCKGKTR